MDVNVNGIDFPVGTSGGNIPACGINSATVSAPPFLGPYTWNGPPGSGITNYPNQTFTTNTTGIYTLTMNPPGACAPITRTINIQFYPNPNATFISNNICNTYTLINTGDPAPSVQTYSFAGASPPTTFTTTNTNSSVIFPAAGTYTIYHTVVNTQSCQTTETLQITVPTLPTVNINVTNASCSSPGSGTVNIAGGTGPYSYTWLPAGGNSSVAVGLSQGNYTVNVLDNNGCVGSGTTSITSANSPSATASQVNSVTCNSGNNGSATVTVNGGVPAYTYTWSNGNNSSNPTGLSAGIYTVTVSDANNCQTTTTVQILQPPALSLTVNSTSVSCNGGNNGSATANVSGGVGGYTYTWAPSGGNNSVASNLTAGNYTVTVNDANGCSIAGNTVITQPPAMSISIVSNSITCNGYSNGSATVTVNGGTLPYSYTWTPTGGNSNIANGLSAGNYSVFVSDANACPINTFVTINEPSPVTLITSPNATICFGQSTNLSANAGGGISPYTYSWNPSNLSGAGPISVNPTVTTIYNVYATDVNGCTSPTKNIQIYVLSPLTATGMYTSVCENTNGVLTVSITSPGNGGPYSYLWSNFATTPSITVSGNYAIQPITYTVTIDDGCTSPSAVAISTLYVNPSPKGYFTGDLLKGCVPLTVNFNAVSSGGASDSFVWDFGNGESGSGNPATTSYTETGVYSVSLTITNQYGCVYDTTASNYIEVYPYPIADFNYSPINPTIVEPVVNFINTSYGATSYTWSFGDFSSPSNTTTIVNPSHTYSYYGTYSVTLIAINQYGCESRITKPLYVDPEFHIYIPNAFTPNGDGLNDVFNVKGVGIDENNFKMYIFDRWGELIYYTTDLYKGWNGTVKGHEGKATQDVYVYKIYVKDLKGGKHEYVGHVTCLPDYDN